MSAGAQTTSASGLVPLAEARDEVELGGKAVQLGAALRAGLPVPDGVALPAWLVDAVAAGDQAAAASLGEVLDRLAPPVAVRSSGLGEDSLQASFAGQHLSVLNVLSAAELVAAVTEVRDSATAESALAYRRRLGLAGEPRTGVVVQRMITADVAGVLFTRNPITGADELVIEASLGLGEAVVAGRVIPDRYRVSRDGTVLERTAGSKGIAIRPLDGGGTEERRVDPRLSESLCLDDEALGQLHELATRCEGTFGHARDIEWAFAGGRLHLLQCRAATG